jgi:hypothetical protein
MALNKTAAKDVNSKLKRKDYEKELRKLQVELCHLQAWVKDKGLRAIILFEGRDTAGKGGTIKALTDRVSPNVPGDCATGADGPRKDAALRSALHPALPGGRRNRDLRPQLVQPSGR